MPRRNDAEMGPANSLHASAYYSEYNERFDLNYQKLIKSLNSLIFCEKFTLIYISLYSLASRIRFDAVELIVRKYLLLWWSFLCFGSYILHSNLISTNALTKLRFENLWKLRAAIINRPIRLQLIICYKKELLNSLSSIKLLLIRNKCY